jgi:alpha-N-arabinofuranosidase
MKWCEVVGTEPYLCLNFGTGTLDEGEFFQVNQSLYDTYITVALGWLEYCNSTRDSYYANLRRKHLGHDKPYNVSFFLPSISYHHGPSDATPR